MNVYKFKVLFENQEDFAREIEILPNQTFEDFHDILLESIGLNGEELASFYICNSGWRKLKEITLLDMSEETENEEVEEDEERTRKKIPIFTMNNAILKNFIDDPHQRMLYVYDFIDLKTFYIELSKIVSYTTSGIHFPRCTKSIGNLPTKPGSVPAAYPGMDDESDEMNDVETEEEDDLFGNTEVDSDFSELNDGFEEVKF